jgi:hypothetical protein
LCGEDGLFCTDDESCDGAGVCAGSPRDCWDGQMCTEDVCDEAEDTCVNVWQPRPELTDVCGDGIDQDCDGLADDCCQGDGTFTEYTTHATGVYAAMIAVADLDADAILDLVVANRSNATVSVLVGGGSGGQGDGTFRPKVDYPVGAGPSAVVTGDFDADGILDLALACRDAGDLSVLLGNGDGGQGDATFGGRTDYPAGTAPVSIAKGDLDADGITDLAVVDESSATVRILTGTGSDGRGDGGFTPGAVHDVCTSPAAIVTTDFDADRILDLAIACRNGQVMVLTGNGTNGRGNGTFSAGSTSPAGGEAVDLVAGDFDADHIYDLAVVDTDAGSLVILLGNGSDGAGNGTFGPPVNHTTGSEPVAVAAADFDLDGIIDLAVASHAGDAVGVFLGNGAEGRGDGTFGARSNVPAGDGPADVVAADFDANGILDLAVANGPGNSAAVLMGRGSGGRGNGLFEVHSVTATDNWPISVRIGDFDSDGIADLAVANRDSDNVSVLLGNGSDGRGDGTFAASVNYGVGVKPYKVATADLDNDGILDLVTANHSRPGSVSVLMGNGAEGRGDGTFAARQDHATVTGNPNAVSIGDVNADGILDLAVSCEYNGAIGNILLGNGDGTFQPASEIADEGLGMYIDLADLNSDGIQDVVIAKFAVGILLCPGQGSDGIGDGTFGTCSAITSVDTLFFFRLVDVNADAIRDIVAVNYNGGADVLLGNGSDGQADGTFTLLGNFPTEWMTDELVLVDLNGDRIRDMVITLRHEDTIDVFLGNGSDGRGDGTFGPKLDIPFDSPVSVAAADFNADGIVDLAVTQARRGQVTILRGQGTCLSGPD